MSAWLVESRASDEAMVVSAGTAHDAAAIAATAAMLRDKDHNKFRATRVSELSDGYGVKLYFGASEFLTVETVS